MCIRDRDKKETSEKKREIKEDIEYKGIPWVYNGSRPISITKGLQNRKTAKCILSQYQTINPYLKKSRKVLTKCRYLQIHEIYT